MSSATRAARLGVGRDELLARVAVDDVLHRRVRAAECQMIASQERRVLLPHVHLQVRAEIHVVAARERHQRAERAVRRCVHDDSEPAAHQRPRVSAHTVSPT